MTAARRVTRFLIYKRTRAGFYRPKAAGYTDSVDSAGRFTKEFAEHECSLEPDNIFMVPAP